MSPTPTTSRRIGIRLKTITAMVVIAVAAVALLGIAVHLLVVRERISQARELTDQRLQTALQVYLATGALTYGAQIDDPALPAPLRETTSRGQRATLLLGSGAERELWAATPADGVVLSVRQPFDPRGGGVAGIDRALVLGGVGTVALAGAASALVGTRLSRRLTRGARAAREVAAAGPGDMAPSVLEVVGSADDEIRDLAAAVDQLTERLSRRLELERRFTADVAHDLRTPVTGMLAAAEALPPGRIADLVRARAFSMRDLVEDLLEVARLDTGVERAQEEMHDLGRLTAEIVGQTQRQHGWPGAEIEVSIAPGIAVLTDRRRVDRILSNLLANARRHGRPPIRVEQNGARVVVSDAGAGFPAELVSDGPVRFRSGAAQRNAGHGLGLTIVLGQAEVLGVAARLANAEGGGARVELDFSAAHQLAEQVNRDLPPDLLPVADRPRPSSGGSA